MEDQERQPARYRARRGPRNEPVRVLFDEATLQALREPQQEPARIPLDEIRRTLHGLDRQRAEERAGRRQGAPQQEATALQPRNGKTIVPIEEIASTLDDLGRQRAEARARQRAEMTVRPPQTPPSRKRRGAQLEGLLTPPPSGQGRPRKRPRLLPEAVQLQQRSIDAILQHQESCFRAKKDASVGRSWCKEVPLALQVETSKSFYDAFTDEKTLPISHCIFCYRKFPPAKLTILRWRECLTPRLVQATTALQKCGKCLPSNGDSQVDICLECRGAFERGKLPKACSVNNMNIGCEHRYPKELDGLSPLEERLVALQAPFGYITKFTVDNKTPSGVSYRKHVKGHIVVFPNNANDLVATVLPHPLLQTIENIHREELSAVERTHTDPIVPNTDRGLEENGFTSIEELLTSLPADPSNDACPSACNTSAEQPYSLPQDLHISAPNPETTDQGDDVLYETSTSGMFPLDGPAAFAEVDKLSFLAEAIQTSQIGRGNDAEPSAMMVYTAGGQPFIRVERGADFADNLHEDFFPRTFPKLFPWGSGGPKALREPDGNRHHALQPVECRANHSLKYWARYVLQRHGGRFATHPVFCFLVFNILLRSTNRRISMVRMARGSFHRLERVYGRLKADRLKRAVEEMRETRTTTDPDILFLLRELSIFGHAQPLSNETRLLMRRKIQAVNIWTGMPAIWITVNPNDVNNPVKMRLSIHRLHEHDTAKELLADLRGRTDQESVFGQISHYYATVETNDRGSLHLHGLLLLEDNMQLPSLVDNMAKPEEEGYRAQVVRYLDSVFHECLDEEAGKAVRKERKPIDPVEGIMHNTEALAAVFDKESNYIAYCCQVHSHTYTCIKYSLKGLAGEGAPVHKRTPYRFKAPWKIVEESGFTEDGLLRIRRNHPLVNRYNKAMAVGLRHNHDVSMILTKTKGLAMVFYITNYATKLDTPMWKRLVFAADVLRQLRESAALRGANPAEQDAQREAVVNESQVCYFLLGYQTDFTNVPHWSYINLTALYWTIFRRWTHLRRQASTQTDAEEPSETVHFRESGRTLLYLDAYAYRGPVLRDVCFYDYMSMITLERRRGQDEDEARIALEGPPECDGWIQKLCQPPEYAVPIFQGFISDDNIDEHPVYFKRNSVLHLALFVPWETFLSETRGDITGIWRDYEATLCPRLRFRVANISLLRKSAEDARKDARLWASRSEGDDTVDVDFPLDECDHVEDPTRAEHHQVGNLPLRDAR
ncbi:hypothetical protein HIM_10125 [Hirsutella minnesotensis 3608]|uniref:Uncharacterized protein n=1 Tax=Hirsutella minnesotensis 3608 TaxID=1043627 RepID=A0A0F7ZG94_9HYPO|nr:hypothetical protein HIM_10125 [Hirsutella minnesotensis 3608]